MAKSPSSNDSDWMKYYCIVFGLLVAVVGYMYLKVSGDREDYEIASSNGEKFITGQGMSAEDRRGIPTTIPGLALQIHQYVGAYKEAMAGSKGGIPTGEMDKAATRVNMSRVYASNVKTDEVRSKNYQTISRDFTYAPCTLEQLVVLMYNIEARGRLRVFEVRWQLQDAKLNTDAPYHKIGKPVIKVGMREPLASTRR